MRLFIVFFSFLGVITVPRLIVPASHTANVTSLSPAVQSAVDRFTTQSRSFAATCTALRQSLQKNDILAARRQLIACRSQYKQIESFLEYFFRTSSAIYNRAPKFEAEDGAMEYQSPIGLQQIESLLYDTHADKKALLEQASAVESSASDLPALLYGFQATDPQLLESLRIELIRIIALDITGYEAPLLKSGIHESNIALLAFSDQLQPYLHDSKDDSLTYYLRLAIDRTTGPLPFDAFDRLTFLKEAALPLQRQLNTFIQAKTLNINTTPALDYSAGDIFSPNALTPILTASTPPPTQTQINLGHDLFFDPSLSTNGKKSCASCHNPARSFTDGLRTSLAFDGHHTLDRNAPTLLYSGFQYSLFWDGRARTLEDQIRTVLHDAREMNADTTTFQQHGGEANITAALAAYVRTLHPMNSRFDQFLRNRSILTAREKAGANLFMGKAQCATCHFIPLFNGLIPPDYALTEFEVLGTTSTDPNTTKNPSRPHAPLTLSPDPGRFTQYPLPFLKGAFKTPTVRNSANTAPYMHNGSFKTLESLLDFYNKGGGAGLGLNVPNQTLPPTPLNLSKIEMNNIILFIHTLTDSLSSSTNTTGTSTNPASATD